MEQKTYIGDAVFARLDKHGRVILTTENGLEATNEIVLEDFVLDALIDYLRLKRKLK